MRAHTELLVAVALAACAARPVIPAANAVKPEDEPARVAELLTDEEQVLEVLAASDPRFAARVGGAKEARLHSASVKALAAGDADAAIEDGALDFFSFTARGRSIEEAEAIVARAPAIEHDADAKLERELLVRLVAEEHARLDEERTLPRGASALVRGIVDTWGSPESRKAAETRDARIARRLDEVRASLAAAETSRVTLTELDDALDPLERIAVPDLYIKTLQSITRLRLALDEATKRAQEDDASWARVQAGLRAHLGIAWDARELRARLEGAEHELRVAAKPSRDDSAEAFTLRSSPCTSADEPHPHTPSRLRTLPPPPERAPICGALGVARDAPLMAVVALHDDVVVALWSLALHESRATPARAVETSRLLGAYPDHEARLIRFAAARPVAAIGAGLAASTLAGSLDSDLVARWLAFGDAPLDIARRELAVPATSSPSGPASPRP